MSREGAERPTPRMPLRVLIFEDHREDVELCVQTLRSAGFEVTADVAVTPEQVAELLQATRYDVILSDYRMPGATGMDAFAIAKEHQAEVPFVLVTGSLGDEKAVECLKKGVSDYVLKDRIVRLPPAVKRALEQRRLREERANAEEARRRAVDELDQFFNLSLEMLCIAGLDGTIRRANPAWKRSLGYSMEELQARPLLDFIDADHRSDCLSTLGALQAGRDVSCFETRFRAKDGSYRWLTGNAASLPQQGIFFAALHDLTERRYLEEQLRERNQELEEQNRRVEAASRMKTEFLANMSHELRSPLNGIIGFSELLYDGKLGRLDGRQKTCLGRILASGRHLLRLISDILDLAKVEAGKLEFRPELVSLPKLISEVTASFALAAAEKNIRMESSFDGALGEVLIDPSRMKQVVYNYLSNAIKFTGEGGSVTITVRPEVGGNFRLEVRDTGAGIADSEVPELFTDFHQLDSGKAKRFQGTGLGLALTKRIVEAQGGSVGVRSKRGQGSTFFAVLPAAPPSPAADDVRSDPIEALK